MLADIEKAKSEGLLQNLYISVGGAYNTFFRNNVSPAALAGSFLSFMKRFGANGIDFDLENMGLTEA